MKAQLNLATIPLETHRRFFAGASLVAAIAGLALLALSWHVYNVRKSNERFRAQIAQLQQEMARLESERQDMETFFVRPENAKLHDRAVYLNSLIDARSFNWTQMFMDLEKLLPPGVRVVSIAPKMEKGGVSVKLTIGASSDESKLKFLRALETSKVFSGIEVLSESPPGRTEATNEMAVEITAWYLRA